MAAAVTGIWICSGDWIEDSHRAGRFLPEAGTRGARFPFEGKTFRLARSFLENTKLSLVEHVRTLIVLGRGRLLSDDVDTSSDYAIIGDSDGDDAKNDARRGGIAYTLKSFLNFCQPG
jgi:hypothetical protein